MGMGMGAKESYQCGTGARVLGWEQEKAGWPYGLKMLSGLMHSGEKVHER